MSARRQPQSTFDRDQAMAGRPRQLQAVRIEHRDNGGLLVTVRLERPRWQRWLGAATTFERSFGLDALGRSVYEQCDGQRSVDHITRSFARAHHVSHAQAQIAVTTFLRTMIRKGLIAIELPRRAAGPSASLRAKPRRKTRS